MSRPTAGEARPLPTRSALVLLVLVGMTQAACSGGTSGLSLTTAPSPQPTQGGEGGGGTDPGNGTGTNPTKPEDPEPQPDPCEAKSAAIEPGPSPIRRLTRAEYDNTINDLFGANLLETLTSPASEFPAEEIELGFDNNARILTVPPRLAEEYLKASEAISIQVTKFLPALLGCSPTTTGAEEVCARTFIENFGKRAWRRPLTTGEVDRIFAVYKQTRAVYPFRAGIRLAIQVMLNSPHFLYRVEFGRPTAATDNVVRLDPWETATRLSYLLWQSMPDDALLQAAETGKLETPEQIAAQARRMLADPGLRHRKAVARFHQQWLGLGELAHLEKDPVLFPSFAAALPLLRKETETFLDRVTWEEDGSFRTLLTAPYTFMNAELAELYGVPGPAGTSFERVSIDTTRRSGFLTHAGLLAAKASPNETNPVRRGLFVREQLLCSPPPPPPDDVDLKPPDPEPGMTTRERFEVHRSQPACAGCHQLMDPIGLAFEHFDADGMWRDLEQGEPVDATGEFFGTDVDGPVDGAVQVAQKLADSRMLSSCVVTQWFRFAHGRAETTKESCEVKSLERQFVDRDLNIPELLVSLTQSDAFLYRYVDGVQP